MKTKINWARLANLFGIAAMIIGVLDPLEGSVLIVAGSVLLTIAAYMRNDPYRKIFITACLMIITGVTFLFYLSSLGGIGGDSGRSMWWGALIFPYPAGWLLGIIAIIIRAVRKQH